MNGYRTVSYLPLSVLQIKLVNSCILFVHVFLQSIIAIIRIQIFRLLSSKLHKKAFLFSPTLPNANIVTVSFSFSAAAAVENEADTVLIAMMMMLMEKCKCHYGKSSKRQFPLISLYFESFAVQLIAFNYNFFNCKFRHCNNIENPFCVF